MKQKCEEKRLCRKIFYYIAYGKSIVTCKIGNLYEALSGKGFSENVRSMKDAIKWPLSARDLTCPDGFIY